MKWIIGNSQMLLLVAAVLSVMGLGLYLKGRADGKASGIAECQLEKARAINDNLRIREKSDNIMRPGDVDYAERLRSGKI